ncbi:MAG: hypothetical protein KDD44_15400, partial [Bdellovibrionales bacterium]|nr:hypothetical protein [Bdellovibrionales bacterium]
MTSFISRLLFSFALGALGIAIGFPSAHLAAVTASKPSLPAVDPALTRPRFELTVDRESVLSDDVLEEASQVLLKTATDLAEQLQEAPRQTVRFQLLSENRFRALYNPPEWTAALFEDGLVSVPVPARSHGFRRELLRTLRHEYAHGVVAELSAGRCPAWFDEGFAQIVEGAPSAWLRQTTRKWLQARASLPLKTLSDGFFHLASADVPVAYAQSRVAVQELLDRHGM